MAAEKRETKSASGEFGHLIRSVTEGWNTPLPEPLKEWPRRGCAFAGSLPWMYYNFNPGPDSPWSSDFAGALPAVLPGTLVVRVLLAAFFAWLIAYQDDRRCSPTRFFLEGLLLPGVAAALLDPSPILESLGGSR